MLELKEKNPNSRSISQTIIIRQKLVSKWTDSEKTLPPVESEKKKASEPSSDIVIGGSPNALIRFEILTRREKVGTTIKSWSHCTVD